MFTSDSFVFVSSIVYSQKQCFVSMKVQCCAIDPDIISCQVTGLFYLLTMIHVPNL